MSKVAEQKALETYPIKVRHSLDANRQYREGYIVGYDQAIQDFLEKVENFFKNELYVSISDKICSKNDFTSMSNFIEQFKNYMQ